MFDWITSFPQNRDRFKHKMQLDRKDCGPTCLSMILDHYGVDADIESLRLLCSTSKDGASMLGISEAAESMGFRTLGASISIDQLFSEVPLPCILHWKQSHFVVCYKTIRGKKGRVFKISDPAAFCNLSYSENEIINHWCVGNYNDDNFGNVLLFEPKAKISESQRPTATPATNSIPFFIRYLRPYKRHLSLVCIGMIFASLLQLIFPFLTKSLVDVGIENNNLNFITLILVSQLLISLSQIIVDFTRNWILLHVNSRVSIGIVSDFLKKLMKLPLHFFESRLIGDVLQRINDHQRIDQFLTGTSLNVFFSLVTFLLFGIVLSIFNYKIFIIYVIGNSLYVLWVLSFLKLRRTIDIKRFYESAGERSNLIQLISGITEIKLNNCENQKRLKWEHIQIKLFNLKIKSLALGQLQYFGSVLFNHSTNIVISYLSAQSVIAGEISLGTMFSITYLVGQLNGPISTLIGFIQQTHDAKLSLERINEINNHTDETQLEYTNLAGSLADKDIIFENVDFGYNSTDLVLNNLNLIIPNGKVTAVVGESGGGKTTIMKLLLGLVEPNNGRIKVGEYSLSQINPTEWRRICGAVMQDGFIFSESIAENIALCDEQIEYSKLDRASGIACINDFINSLPMKYRTIVGMEGHGLSQGQKQRLLIARLAYKDPQILILDEATNALDSKTESSILKNLNNFFKEKTVVIIAHRLSTVKNADKIVVIKNGKVLEEGNHESLLEKRGEYYQLVQRQI